jgi:hypothetical protein
MNIQAGELAEEGGSIPGVMLSDAYEIWLQADHPKKVGTLNLDRSKTDLLNHKRALHCFAAGFSNGSKSAEQIPLSALEAAEPLVAKQVVRGVELLTAHSKSESKQPTKKTISNLVSCLKAIRAVVLKGRSVSPQGKSARKQLSELPKRRSRRRFPVTDWPSRFASEWSDYRAWKIKPLLTASEGASYRRTPCRPRTIDDAHISNINPYVGFIVTVCGMHSFGLVDVCSPELFGQFINWHLSQDADGGYVFLKGTASVLATLSQYLVATGQLPETVGEKKPWDVFYDMGREVMRLGAARGEITTAPDIGDWKPSDLRQLGVQGWELHPPQDKMTSPYVQANSVFNRKRTALFFYLAYETPLRARNWLEMQWHKHMLMTEDGRWKVRFVGDELKIGRRGYVTNVYELIYSEPASRMIDLWRGVLRERFGPNFEMVSPHVFPPNNPHDRRSGSQLSYGAFSQGVKSLVMELRGETFHPHKIRHIVGSYLVNEYGAGGLGLAETLLGDTPQVILDAYYRPNTKQDLADYMSNVR